MSNKRKETAQSRSNKKQKLNTIDNPIDETWISASKTRNYMLNDPLLDWLNLYGEKKGFIKDVVKDELNFSKFIMNKGIEFESYIISQIKVKYPEDFHEVSSLFEQSLKYKQQRQLNDTLELMRNGAKIIYQGLVYNQNNKTWGYPDLIVRSDFLNKIVISPIISDEKSKKGCKFSDEYHYRIVDIKFASLRMKVDGKSLLNQGSVKPYKAQTYIYNRALGYMQNLVPRKAYLLGRGWSTLKNSSFNPFDKLGTVDFVDGDKEIEEEVKASIEWIQNVRNFGDKWNILPSPSVPELYPNMCNDYSNDWCDTKRKIADELKEITMIWQCGVGDRELAHSKKVYKWTDEKCTAELMNKGGKINPPMINKILEVNRGDKNYYIEHNSNVEWKKNDNVSSFFIDFETITNINNIRSSDEDGNIFMIGVLNEHSSGEVIENHPTLSGEEEKSNSEFNTFTSTRLTARDEKKIIEDFLVFLKNNIKNNKVRLYHYCFAEPSTFKKAIQKYNIKVDIEIEWIDLLLVVKSLKFIVKGAMDFSLKSIINALYKNGMVNVSYENSEICNGSQAMIAAFVADEYAMENSVCLMNTELIKHVRDYNKIDCVVLRCFRDILEKI